MSVRMGDVWDRTTAFLGDHAGACAALAVPGVLLPLAVQGLLEPAGAAWPGSRYFLSTLNLILSVVSLWGQLALVALAAALATGGAGAARAQALRRLPAAIGIVLLMLVVAAVLGLPAIAILNAYGFDFASAMAGQTATLPEGAGGPFLLFLLLYALIVLFVGARLAVLYPVVTQERRGIGAFARAWQLTRGLTWRITGVVLLFAIVAIVAVLAVQTVFGAALTLLAGGEGAFTAANVVTPILVAAVSTVLTVISCVFTALLYRAVLNEREAGRNEPGQSELGLAREA